MASSEHQAKLVRDAKGDELQSEVKRSLAACTAGPVCASIGYLPAQRPTKDEWSRAVETFQSLGDKLDAYEVTLSIEPVNYSETCFLRTAREAMQLCESIGHARVGVIIDTFHANIEERNIAAAITSLGPYLNQIHASENDRGLLGKGHIDFPAIVSALKKTG